MRKTILFILIILSISCSYSQKNDPVQNKQKYWLSIKKDTTLKTVVLDTEDFLDNMPDGGAELIGYYKSGQLRRIALFLGLSNGNEQTDFYFRNDSLIYVFEEFKSFPFDEKNNQLRKDTTEKTYESHSYFENNLIIDRVAIGVSRHEGDTKSTAKRLISEATELKKILDQKN